MHVDGFPPLDDAVKYGSKIARPKGLVFSVTLLCANNELLPVLEGLLLIKVLHSIEDFRHEFAALFFVSNILLPSIPQKPQLEPRRDGLLVERRIQRLAAARVDHRQATVPAARADGAAPPCRE